MVRLPSSVVYLTFLELPSRPASVSCCGPGYDQQGITPTRRFANQSCDSNAATEFIRGTTTPLILEDDDPLLRSEISATEIATSIRRLPLGRAPGWDDLPCKFYMAYEDFLVNALKRVCEASQLGGALRLQAYLAPHGELTDLGNVLLRHLRPHLPVLVPQCQTYAVLGRSPSLNIARVCDEVDAAVRTGWPLAVISTDLESALDTLDRDFLVSLMVSLQLPLVFIGWFLLLYAGADATIRAGGLHTKPFQLLNGVRQGCAISAAMFSLATSPLLLRLEQALGTGNVLTYADDIVLLIRSEDQFGVVTSIFENFRRASGIKGNFTKSKGLWCSQRRSTRHLLVVAQERHILVLIETLIMRWYLYTRGLSLFGRARAANSLVFSSVVNHIHGYLPTDCTIHKIQARLARFIWGPERTARFRGSVLARLVSLGVFGLIDIETQLRLSCFKGVQAALRGSRNAYSWLVESGAWLYPPPSGSWLSPRRLRLLKIWEAVADILTLDHYALTPPLLLNLPFSGHSTFWLLPGGFCRRLIDENLRGTYRVNTIGQAVVLRGTTTPFLRVITRTARRILERPHLTALPIVQFARRWEEHINQHRLVIAPALRLLRAQRGRGSEASSVALPHPAHPASAQQSCVAFGSGDLSLVHRYWSSRYIRPLIQEAFTIIRRAPDLQGWVFGHGLDDDALAILARNPETFFQIHTIKYYQMFKNIPYITIKQKYQTIRRQSRSSHRKKKDAKVLGTKFQDFDGILGISMSDPCHRKRRQFKQTDAFTRGMVIGLKRAGHRLWRRWLEQGNVAIYRNVGATRVTSARVDRRILRQAVAAPQATCTAILQHVQDTLDHSISTRTISRRLVANGLHSCRPLRRLPLTPPNRRRRLEWCRARSTWMTEWHRVVFSDESRFCLSSDSRRVRVWRRRGERSNPAAIVERPTVRQRGIMVWGAIAYDSRSPLLRIQGTMTAQRYVDDVLRPVTLPYLQGVPNALYQQDNVRPHTARISQQALQDVQMLPWPPYSPDLSPIEHVWDIIGRRLHALPQPRSEEELWQMVEREWRAIPHDAIRTLIDSLPRRVAACIAVRGGPTCY
ncbi:Transposase [Cordylochernes scorpioides]|uniref:Transposase n=1 Tax=Cordylochernes scorpioides TaxID=51811 RepID=A0ABY6L651_9ARAC|nr:Transposase [Cordylochernes scorpioides]